LNHLPDVFWTPTDQKHEGKCYKVAKMVLMHKWFDNAMGLIILANSVSIGIDQHLRIQGETSLIADSAETVFLVIYVLELALRFYVMRCSALLDGWVRFDTLCVVVGVVMEWVIGPLLKTLTLQNIAPVQILRTARLARLLKTVRVVKKFRQLWMLIRSFMLSFYMVLYTLATLALILYVLAIFGVELIRLHPSYEESGETEYKKAAETYFSSLPTAMLSLVQFVCMDSIGAIYKPMIEARSSLAIYFMSVILIVAIVYMNIVTAVLVNGSLEQAAQDKELMAQEVEKQKKSNLRHLFGVFHRLDHDNSGQVDRQEMIHASPEDRALLDQLLGITDPLEVFDLLDEDGGGTLDIDEFCEGLYECSVSKHPIIIKRIDQQVALLRRDVTAILRHIDGKSISAPCSITKGIDFNAQEELKTAEQTTMRECDSFCGVFVELQNLKACLARLEIECVENSIWLSRAAQIHDCAGNRSMRNWQTHVSPCEDMKAVVNSAEHKVSSGNCAADDEHSIHDMDNETGDHRIPTTAKSSFRVGLGYVDEDCCT